MENIGASESESDYNDSASAIDSATSDSDSATSDSASDSDSEPELDDDERIDTSWIDNFKREETSYNQFYNEPVTSIKLYFLYATATNQLIHIGKQKYKLTEENTLKNYQLIALIKQHEFHNKIKYKLNSILRYNIDVNPDEIEKYTTNVDKDDRFFSIEKYLNDIHFNASILMFHNLNALYFIYSEDNKNHSKTASASTGASASTDATIHPKMNHTKKIFLHKKMTHNKTICNNIKKT